MKKQILLTFLIGFMVSILSVAQADPFAICKAYSAGENAPTSFILLMDNNATIREEAPLVLQDGSLKCHFDLAGIAIGNHTISIKSKNLQGVSAASIPFVFTKALPTVPLSVGLSSN